MASIQAQTIRALIPDREYVVHGQISSGDDLTNCIEFCTGEDSDGTAITVPWDFGDSTYSPFTYAQYTAKYTEIENAEPMRLLRKERNLRIAETDWWASSDITMTQAQTDYRQALRDITDTYSSLDDVVWPEKP